ncbi:MAG: hypothetical protein WAZ77_07310 [Candidatus Nitrosopolaris sp.]
MFSKGQGEGLSGVATRSRMNSYVKKLGGNEDQIESSVVKLYYFTISTFTLITLINTLIKSSEVIDTSTGQNNTSPENQYTNINASNCDMPGYLSCWDLGHFAGNQTSLQMGCPGLSNGNKTQADNYGSGFKEG